MGWDVISRRSYELSAGQTEFFKKQFTFETDRLSSVVKKISKKGFNYFLVVEHYHKDSKEIEPWVCTIMTHTSKYSFAYKCMEESTGPYIYAPASFVRALDFPPPNDWAKQWREVCLERERRAKA